MKKEQIHSEVRKRYGEIARQGSSCCGSANPVKAASTCCCGGSNIAEDISRQVGYSPDDLSAVPEGANLGLGCGNPVALASLKKGETVLDLGSGAGFDCFLASGRVGPEGKVIGVDMTPEMLERARKNAIKGVYKNVEFRLGEIENLPVADSSDKQKVFNEAFRVLKPGGRLMVSDMVLLKELPRNIKDSVYAYIGCIAGAMKKDSYIKAIKNAGFSGVKVVEESVFEVDSIVNVPEASSLMKETGITADQLKVMSGSISSARVQAYKPV